MGVLILERASGEEVTNNNFERVVTLCLDRNLNATPTEAPETPTKPDREAPPDKSPTPPPSPWKPATKPHECPQREIEGLPLCANKITCSEVRRAD
jgi:hypothetical protein